MRALTASGSWSPTSTRTTVTLWPLTSTTTGSSGLPSGTVSGGSVGSVSLAIVLPVPSSRKERVSTSAAARVEMPSRTSMMIRSRRAAIPQRYGAATAADDVRPGDGCSGVARNRGCGDHLPLI